MKKFGSVTMATIIWTLIWLVICIILGRNFVAPLGCSCRKEHFQTDFCESDFVVEVKVESMLGGRSFKPYQPYKVTLLEICKGKKYFDNGLRRDTLFAPGIMHFCGQVKMNVGERYLVQGYERYKTMYAYVCRSVTNMNDVTSARMLMMDRFDCSCSLYINHDWDMIKPMPKSEDRNKCVSPIPGSCLFTNGACVKNNNETCQWEIVQPCT